MQLQDEIDDALPEIQEMIIALSRPNPSSQAEREALNARKHLLSLLASYDSLSKRIRDLPLPGGDAAKGSSQDRLQKAMATRAQYFLSEKMALLKSMGFEELEERTNAIARKNRTSILKPQHSRNDSNASNTKASAVSEEQMAKLAVLLEQEKLVESCVSFVLALMVR